MSELTEVEILDCLKSNLRQAAEHCTKLASDPYRGEIYNSFRKELKLVEGCCRQIAYWRDGDARWLPLGLYMAEAHQRAGKWLRTGRRTQQGTQDARKASHPLFQKLAENLLAMLRAAEDLETRRTGRTGAMLPMAQPLHREHRPVSVILPRKSGLILPPGYA